MRTGTLTSPNETEPDQIARGTTSPYERLRAAARPPLRPAAFFCAVVPPCRESPPEPDFLPPRLEAPGELAIFAARSFDMPLSFRASYCFSFLTFAFLFGIWSSCFRLAKRKRCESRIGYVGLRRIGPWSGGSSDGAGSKSLA